MVKDVFMTEANRGLVASRVCEESTEEGEERLLRELPEVSLPCMVATCNSKTYGRHSESRQHYDTLE